MTELTGTRDETATRLDLAKRIAREAGRRGRWFLRHPDRLATTQKSSPQDLVSAADKSIETYIRRAIQRHFPKDGIIGEEANTREGTTGFVWVIDPIDGTMAYLVGQPNWSISIAVLRDGDLVVGVIEAPLHGETYVAAKSHGATLNGRHLAIRQDWTIRSTAIGYGASTLADPDGAGHFVRKLYAAGGVLFRVGSGALMLAYVASNRLAGYYDPKLYGWDCLAGILLIREAGGVAEFTGDTDRAGALWAGNMVVFADLKNFSASSAA